MARQEQRPYEESAALCKHNYEDAYKEQVKPPDYKNQLMLVVKRTKQHRY